MRTPRLAAIVILALCARAQSQSVVPDIPEVPDKESPFFVLNNQREDPARHARKDLDTPQNDYPRNKTGEESAGRMLSGFFTDMFASVHLTKAHGSGSKLVVEPTTFSLDDRREINVTFSVQNRSRQLVKLDFPTSQRIEILVRDPNGKVIEKWSDDRSFDDVSGVVMINPGERIQYEEHVATRDMQPGRTYTIEASLANNPEFTKTATVQPSGKPRDLAPNPTPTPAPSPAPQAAPVQG